MAANGKRVIEVKGSKMVRINADLAPIQPMVGWLCIMAAVSLFAIDLKTVAPERVGLSSERLVRLGKACQNDKAARLTIVAVARVDRCLADPRQRISPDLTKASRIMVGRKTRAVNRLRLLQI